MAHHVAAENGKDEILLYCISNGCDVNKKDGRGDTCLDLAVKRDRKMTAMILLMNGAKLNQADKYTNDHKFQDMLKFGV
jgi:ankyrin repeat protein